MVCREWVDDMATTEVVVKEVNLWLAGTWTGRSKRNEKSMDGYGQNGSHKEPST